MKILKFGGSSVGTPERIKNVIEIVKNSERKNKKISVVFSAFQGVTDTLIAMSRKASSGDSAYISLFNALKIRHLEAVNSLVEGNFRKETREVVEKKLSELKNVLLGIKLVKEISPRTLDLAMSFGERLSAYIISRALNSQNIPAEFLDSSSLVITDDNFGNARVDFEKTNKNIKEYFAKHKNLQIITGFIGSTPNKEITTLGRGGSDYSAAIFGAALNVEEIEIWTDVNGVLTADPRKVSNAFPVSAMTFEEAMEMSHFGAKVIYPPTMRPALEKNIPVRILNSFNPDFEGTVISKKAGKSPYMIKGISSIDSISLLRIQGSGMVGIPGIAKRIFGALAGGMINVILITQASSEHSICLAVLPSVALKAKKLIEEELKFEIRDNIVDEVIVENDLAIIAVVGENMRQTRGIAGKVFQSLGKSGVNITAIAQGSSELNISAVVSAADEKKALNSVHNIFFRNKPIPVNIFVCGYGLIGRELINQIREKRESLCQELDIDLRIIAIADSKKYLINEKGIDLNTIEKKFEKESASYSKNGFIKKLIHLNLPDSVFVDCTASEFIAGNYLTLMNAGISIVTANKIANSGKQKYYDLLKSTAAKTKAGYFYNTTVGAGLPILSTINYLSFGGDKITGIKAVLSGTLSFLFNSFDGTISFSRLLKEAQMKGYTEPDPRIDLSGKDVARKLLIILREAGFKLEPEKIKTQNLIPSGIPKNCDINKFFNLLEKNDFYDNLINTAQSENKVLRYIAGFNKGKAEIKLQMIDKLHPLYDLKSTDNKIAVFTENYYDNPLIIQGKGAGATVTSSGLLSDIIKAAEKFRD